MKVIKKCYSLTECLKEYEKLLDEGRDVFWGQMPEGWYEITEEEPKEDK